MLYPGDAAAAVCSGRAVSLVAASAGYPLIVPAPAAAAAAYCYIHRHRHTSMTLENIEDIIDNSDSDSDSVLFDL